MKTKTLSEAMIMNLVTIHLQALSVIDDDEEVTKMVKAPNAYDVKIEKVQND